MEKKILQGLEFNLSKPLPIHFLRRFTKAAGTLGDRQYSASKYFMELASIDYEMTKYKPSQVTSDQLLCKEFFLKFLFIDRCCLALLVALHFQLHQERQRLVDSNTSILFHFLFRGLDANHETSGYYRFDVKGSKA